MKSENAELDRLRKENAKLRTALLWTLSIREQTVSHKDGMHSDELLGSHL